MVFNDGRSPWQRLRPHVLVFDIPLAIVILLLLSVGLVTLYSAGLAIPGKVADQVRNIVAAFFIMWLAANISPQALMRLAVPAYALAVLLLLAVALFGTIKGGSRRWITIGIQLQPSEFMKIAMPLMLAWFFQRQAGQVRWHALALVVVHAAPQQRQAGASHHGQRRQCLPRHAGEEDHAGAGRYHQQRRAQVRLARDQADRQRQ